MIRTVNLTKLYGSQTAVNAVNIRVESGEIYALLGPNGAGKTTTLNMLAGVLPASSGEIWIGDQRNTGARLDLRNRIGFVPERHPIASWRNLDAVEYLTLFGSLFAVSRLPSRIAHLLERVGLSKVSRKPIHTYSHGMLQKLSIVRALLHDPDVLLLDEPISGLDPEAVRVVRELIVSESGSGRTILISSHQLSEMERICARVGIMYQGRLVAQESIDRLVSTVGNRQRMTVELERSVDGLENRLGALPFVHDCEIDGSIVRLSLPTETDFRGAVSKAIIAGGAVPIRIEVDTPSLEDAFVTITDEHIRRFINAGGSQ